MLQTLLTKTRSYQTPEYKRGLSVIERKKAKLKF